MTTHETTSPRELPLRARLPGLVAAALVVLTTSLWTFWGIAELFYEGWGQPFPAPLAYLVPGAICLVLSLLAITWPSIGGGLLILVGGGFTVWWWRMMAVRAGGLTLTGVLSMFPVSGMLVVTGILFLLEARYRRRRAAAGWHPPAHPLLRHAWYLAAVGVPLAVVAVVSAFQLPVVLGRLDDGDRGARLIAGNGVTLVWAPEGPGWNWKQPWGGYPAWHSMALYGAAPIGIDKRRGDGPWATASDLAATGLCRYVSADGTTLEAEPQDVWRLPTAEEVVRSLVRDGQHAGCAIVEGRRRAVCERDPDKETPLWAPNREPIYYWTADEIDSMSVRYVSYNGWIEAQRKTWGNPRHGYRCVRQPVDNDKPQAATLMSHLTSP